MWVPPSDPDRARARPGILTWTLLALNVFLFLVSVAAGLDNSLFDWGFRPASPHLGPAFASLFLHAGFFHLFGNMWFLVTFGPRVEARIGIFATALTWILAHAFALLAHTLTNRYSTIPVVGASGAISGLLGVYAFLFASRKLDLHVFLGLIRVFKFQARALLVVVLWLAWQLGMALWDWAHPSQAGGVAYWAHLGGIALGLILGFMYKGLGLADPPGPS